MACKTLALALVALGMAAAVSGRTMLDKEMRILCSTPVKYSVLNKCDWSAARHPVDYPSNAHWSPLCGTYHNAKVNLFKEGGMATLGIKDVAEAGNHTNLEAEVAACNADGNCAGYVQWMCSEMSGTCDHVGSVQLTMDKPYLSLVSMVAPSPDWFVGIDSANLCGSDGYWVKTYSRELFGYDAGTDSGETFLSDDAVTDPQEPITKFDPKDPSNIFYNPEQMKTYPLCTITLTMDGQV